MGFSLRHSILDIRYSGVRPSSAGFTLLEVIVSMALIATALMAVMELQSQNLDLQSESAFMTLGKLLVQERWSRIQAEPHLSEGQDSGDAGEDYPGFSYRQEIRRAGSGSRLYEVTVQVFTDRDKPERTLSVKGYLYRGMP